MKNKKFFNLADIKPEEALKVLKRRPKMSKDLKIPVVVSEVKARLVLEIEPIVKVNGKIARVLTTPDTRIELIQGEVHDIINLIKRWQNEKSRQITQNL